MPRVRIDDAKKAGIIREIEDIIEQHGAENYPWKDVAARHGVSRASIYRWVQQVMARGVVQERALRKVHALARGRAYRARRAEKKRGAGKTKGASAKQRLVEGVRREMPMLPMIPTDRKNLTISDLVVMVGSCIDNAQALLEHAKDKDGRPRNTALMLAASEHVRRSSETLARMLEQLWDVGRVERWFAEFFEELTQYDPEFVALAGTLARQHGLRLGFQAAVAAGRAQ